MINPISLDGFDFSTETEQWWFNEEDLDSVHNYMNFDGDIKVYFLEIQLKEAIRLELYDTQR